MAKGQKVRQVKKSKGLINFIKTLIPFLKSDAKILEFEALSNIKKKIINLINWIKLVIDGFLKNHCMLRASALTYTTFLSIVPFMAVAFAIATGFGFESTDFIRNILLKITMNNMTITDHIINSISNAKVGSLGAVGAAALFITVLSLYGNIEKSFNAIWGIKKGRTIGRKFTDYLSVTVVAPILMIVAMSITTTASTKISQIPIIQKILSIWIINFLVSLIPYLFVGFALTFLYIFLTNTTVRLKYALAGGAITGIILQIAQGGFIKFGVAVGRSAALYQKFAPLFIFFIGVYLSWVIVLLGSVMCFAFQNFKTFQKETGALKISNDEKLKLAVKILILLTKNFESDAEPLTNEEISGKSTIPVTLVNEILFILEKSRVVIEIDKEGGEYYSLIKPPERIYIKNVIEYLNKYKEQDFKAPADKEYKYIASLFDNISKEIEKSKLNINLKDILARIK